MYDKQPNHLAQLIDHQAAAGSALPSYLTEAIKQYTSATNELKKILVDCLPDEILQHCQVVGLSNHQLTLSVHSQTAANHIRYLHIEYVNLLREQSVTFSDLQKIRVIVSHLPANLINSNQTTNKNMAKKPTNNTNKGLSEKARQTIAHTANHVILDERLKKSLLRLAKED